MQVKDSEIRAVLDGSSKVMDITSTLETHLSVIDILIRTQRGVLSSEAMENLQKTKLLLKESLGNIDSVLDEYTKKISDITSEPHRKYEKILVSEDSVRAKKGDSILVDLPDYRDIRGYSIWVNDKFYDEAIDGMHYEIRFYKDSNIVLYNYEEVNRRYVIADKKVITGSELKDLFDSRDKYEIFQLRPNTENLRDYAWADFKWLNDHGLSVDYANYESVYDGVLGEDETLEMIFEKFNLDRPEDFFGHSLSMSDVVTMRRGNETKAYYVDRVGFKELDNFLPSRNINRDLTQDEYEFETNDMGNGVDF